MSFTAAHIRIGVQFYLTGRLQVDSYGTSGTGRYFSHYKVRIVNIKNDGRPYPILLGDNYSNMLGWVSRDMLLSETEIQVEVIQFN